MKVKPALVYHKLRAMTKTETGCGTDAQQEVSQGDLYLHGNRASNKTEIFLLHDTKTKLFFDAMKLSPFCKLRLIAKEYWKSNDVIIY